MYGSYGTGSYGSSLYGSSSSSSLGQLNSAVNSAQTAASWAQPVFWISLIGAILVFFLFLTKKNEGKFKGFVAWLYDFLAFKKMVVESILKIAYIFVALYITIMSFSVIGANFGMFLLILVGGNILVRVIYEIALVLLIVCKNTTEINKKLSKEEKEDK